MPVYYRLTREAGLLEIRESYMRASGTLPFTRLGGVMVILLGVLGPVRVRVDAYGPDGGVFREFCCKCTTGSLGAAIETIVRSRSPAALRHDGIVARAPIRIGSLVAELMPLRGRYRGVRVRLLLARNFLLDGCGPWCHHARYANVSHLKRFGKDVAIYIEGDVAVLEELLEALQREDEAAFAQLPQLDLSEAEEKARRVCRSRPYILAYEADGESNIHLDVDKHGELHGVYVGRPEMLAGIGVPASSTIIIECYEYSDYWRERRVVKRVRDGKLSILYDPDVEAMISACTASQA